MCAIPREFPLCIFGNTVSLLGGGASRPESPSEQSEPSWPWDYRRMKNTWLFYTSLSMVLTQFLVFYWDSFINHAFQTVHNFTPKWVNFTVCKLHLNEVAFRSSK